MRGTIRITAFAAGFTYAVLSALTPGPVAPPAAEASLPKFQTYVDTYVTGYNTVVRQTDSTPCIGASGANICGRRDTVACPPMLKLGTVVEIHGKQYVCHDRTARKFHGRFDINCDKDMKCPYKVTGKALVRVVME